MSPRSVDRGYETNPLRVGAPLPPDLPALPVPPTVDEIAEEIDRAEVELMYAIAKHRKAWAAMRRRSQDREEEAKRPGGLASLESDSIWKKRTGDVGWWRAEMEARATTMLALHKMHEWRKAEIPTDTRPTTIWGWPVDGSAGPPSQTRYDMANIRLHQIKDRNLIVQHAEIEALHALIESYEEAQRGA